MVAIPNLADTASTYYKACTITSGYQLSYYETKISFLESLHCNVIPTLHHDYVITHCVSFTHCIMIMLCHIPVGRCKHCKTLFSEEVNVYYWQCNNSSIDCVNPMEALQ